MNRARAGILLATVLAALLTVLGCSSDRGIAERYKAEKLAWRAAKVAHAMRRNPELATDQMRGRLAAQYEEIIGMFPPPSDPSLLNEAEVDAAVISGTCRLKLAALRADVGDLGRAESLFASVRDSYAFSRELAIEATIAYADLMEFTDRWPESVAARDVLVSTWPPAESETDVPDARILGTPVRVAEGYLARGDARSDSRFESARSYLRDWESRWPDSPTAELAAGLVAGTYVSQERWSEAVASYEEMDGLYGREGNRAGIWLTLASILSERLGQHERAREYLGRVVTEYPGDVASATASMELAMYEMDSGDCARARERLERVAADFEDDPAIRATALQHIANCYEREGMWDGALAKLNELAREHPTSIYGLTALQHVAEHYEERGEEAAAAAAWEKAADQYENVIRDYVMSPAELTARGYLIDTRLRQERWEDAAALMVETAERFSGSASSPAMMFQAADIYESRLGLTDEAIRVLGLAAEMFEGRPVADEARRRIGRLES
jgi:tetratricopeptide (TPR) repeat protein